MQYCFDKISDLSTTSTETFIQSNNYTEVYMVSNYLST